MYVKCFLSQVFFNKSFGLHHSRITAAKGIVNPTRVSISVFLLILNIFLASAIAAEPTGQNADTPHDNDFSERKEKIESMWALFSEKLRDTTAETFGNKICSINMETESLSCGVSAFCPVGSAAMAEARNIFKIQ